ncbi:hypothetical protein IG631_07085 [Alternaria alternata]|nr:hypothetical protein IG631_07085 [Alternaria alternata]
MPATIANAEGLVLNDERWEQEDGRRAQDRMHDARYEQAIGWLRCQSGPGNWYLGPKHHE